MKRIYSPIPGLGLALIFFLSLTGCNKSDNMGNMGNTGGNTGSNKVVSGSPTPVSSPSASPSPTKEASASNFVGTWRPVSDGGGEDSPLRLVIKDDGTYTIKSKTSEKSIGGTYTVSGDTATLSDPDGKGDDGIATIESDGRLKIHGTKSNDSTYFVKE